MTLDELLSSLFPHGHAVKVADGLIGGMGTQADGSPLAVLGVAHGREVGVEQALALARQLQAVTQMGGRLPILVLIDSGSQRMSKRDELLGLNEYLAHLAKSLIQARMSGHPTIGLLYGHSAAGAFIATALSTQVLLALPGAQPEVMDLPSMARVTKLPIEVLAAKAQSTPVFAPGLDNLARTGAIDRILDPQQSLQAQLAAVLADWPADPLDRRDERGHAQGGRLKAAAIARRVQQWAADIA